MLLDAEQLTTYQRCKRRYALEREYQVNRWRPKALYEKLLRDAIFRISNGWSAKDAANEAATQFLEFAARPGLDTLHDPYTLARDFCSILSTSIEAISRLVLLTVKPGPTIKIGDHQWKTSAFIDELGVLHQWYAVERWDEDTKWQKLHSWEVFGDCAANASGMSLHIIEIGRSSKGHQHTPWARTFGHPAILGRHQFQHRDGSKLEGNWKPKWFQDSAKNEAKDWVDLMEGDGVSLVHHLDIREPDPAHVKIFRQDMDVEGHWLGQETPWEITTMHRPACDLPPCPWQPVCYAPPGLVNIEGLGLYSRRK